VLVRPIAQTGARALPDTQSGSVRANGPGPIRSRPVLASGASADNAATYEKEVAIAAPRNELEVRHEQSVGRPARASTTTPTASASVADTQAYAVGDEARRGQGQLFALFPRWACEHARY
jgi:hypothetical protein